MYDSDSVKQEFGKYGLVEILEINEVSVNKPSIKFTIIKCKNEL